MTDTWTEIRLAVRPDQAEEVADFLAAFTGAGVVIEPRITPLGPEEGYLLDEAAPLVLKAYLAGEVPVARRAAFRRHLRGLNLDGAVVGRVRWGSIREEDWAEAWKSYYDIERVGRVVIRPAWRDYEAGVGDVVVSLDPGVAFGTGQHPTTRMCLQALQDYLRPGDRLLDLGTGSGILAIAGIALGASECLAVDIEEQVVKAARANVALNVMEDRVRVRLGSVELAANEPPFAIVLANISAAIVSRLSEDIWERLQPGGHLFAGGVIAEREAECAAALTAAGFAIVTMAEGEWRTLIARR